MNEIDFYVSLIDEKEANSILKFLNKNIMSNNLELKKTKIKNIFRGREQVKKNKKIIIDPFWECISRHKLDIPEGLTEKEFINIINESTRKISDYEKFANLKLRFPDKIQEYLDKINKNIENDKYMFDFELNFQDESEVIEYFNKIAYVNDNEKLISTINKFYEIAIKNNLIEHNAKNLESIKKWSLLDLYSEISGIEESDMLIIKYEYIKTHTEINRDLLNKFAMDILIQLLAKYSTSAIKVDMSNINKYVEQINSFKEDIRKVELKRKEMEKEYKKIIRDNQKEISDKEIELNNIKNKNNFLENKLKEVSDQIDKIKTLVNKNNELEKVLTNEKSRCQELERRIKSIEAYYEYAFGIDGLSDKKIFGIIHSNDMNIKITKTIFNEVEFIALDKWKEKINDVNKIYIQRQGINSKKLNEIKRYCLEQGIMSKVISIDNEKTLIEVISRIKENKGGI